MNIFWCFADKYTIKILFSFLFNISSWDFKISKFRVVKDYTHQLYRNRRAMFDWANETNTPLWDVQVSRFSSPPCSRLVAQNRYARRWTNTRAISARQATATATPRSRSLWSRRRTFAERRARTRRIQSRRSNST